MSSVSEIIEPSKTLNNGLSRNSQGALSTLSASAEGWNLLSSNLANQSHSLAATMNTTFRDIKNGLSKESTTHHPNSIIEDGTIQPHNHNSSPFSHIYTPAPHLASSRYNRQMLIPSVSLPGQQRILSAKVLIIGLGGLGSPAALYLAGAGVGTLGLLDNDHVESSNLHRQIVHTEDSVREGLGKVASAARGCEAINSEIEIVEHEMRFAMENLREEEIVRVMQRYDIVLDCTDNPATRYLISDLCVLLGKTLVSGAAQRLEGQVLVLNYRVSRQFVGEEGDERIEVGSEVQNGVENTATMENSETLQRGPCYRCVFPTPPSPEMVRGCGEIGILGPVVGTIGTLMASETLRLIVKGVEETRKPTMLLYSAWPTDPRSMFRTIGLRGRRMDCVACGDEATLAEKGLRKITREEILEGRLDYVAFCGLLEDVRLLSAERRISASEFLRMTGEGGNTSKMPQKFVKPLLVDTREPSEVAMGPKIMNSVNIPFTRILRQDRTIDELETTLHDGPYDSVLFICQRGNDSQVAAQKMLDLRGKRAEKNGAGNAGSVSSPAFTAFVGDLQGGYVAIEKAIQATLISRTAES